MAIQFLVMDVDGTLTDGKIYMGPGGEICKAFNIKDGSGIRDLLIPSGIRPIIITGRESDILSNRCKELGIRDVWQGVADKLGKLSEIVGSENLHTVAYIGDDINDLSCMEAVGVAGGFIGCPADAADRVKERADFISSKSGGEGAVREYIEWIMGRRSTVDTQAEPK